MSSPKRHHFVPQFMLQRWCGANDRLPGFRLNADLSISALNVRPEETAFEGHLYALDHVPDALRQVMETGFFRDQIDTPAAPILMKMLTEGVESLTAADRITWARFLIASRVRTPEWAHSIRAQGKEVAEAALLNSHAEYQAARGGASEETLLEWVENRYPERVANAGIALLPELICNPQRNRQLAEMPWAVFDLSDASVDVLIGDRPAIVTAGIDAPNYAWALPISPSHLFVAAGRAETLEKIFQQPSSRLARLVNESTVTIARRCVYGVAHPSFVRKRFGLAYHDNRDARR